jgi:hypothetical protein
MIELEIIHRKVRYRGPAPLRRRVFGARDVFLVTIRQDALMLIAKKISPLLMRIGIRNSPKLASFHASLRLSVLSFGCHSQDGRDDKKGNVRPRPA